MRRVSSLRTRAARSVGRHSVAKEFGLRLEALEDRTFLSVSPLSVGEFVNTPVTADASVIAALAASSGDQAAVQDFADGAPALYRRGTLVDVFAPTADSDVDRGIALRSALAAAQFGDNIVLSAFIYDMGGDQHVEFPAGVTVSGAGKTATRLTSSVPIQIDPNATYTLNNQTTIEDLWLEGSLHNGWYQTLVGMARLPTENVTTYLRRVQITGDSDGIFLWTGNQYQYTLEAYDCDISTNFDSVALLGSGYNTQTVKLWNCNITAAQPSGIPDGISNGINISSGNVQIFNSTLNAIGNADSTHTNAVWAVNVGVVEVRNSTLNVSTPHGSGYDFEIDGYAYVAVTDGTGSGPNGTYISSSGTENYQSAMPSEVLSKGLFYNNSTYDGFDPAANPLDAGAIAPDKTPLTSGTATFANVTGYKRGINGLVIDVAGVHGSIRADDFVFKVGNDNSPSTWLDAPQPLSVTMFGDLGVSGTDRVEIIWPDGAVAKQWLEVTLLANTDTRLDVPDIFYFGNAVGDSGVADSAGFQVSSADEISARNNPKSNLGTPATISDVNDFDRDGNVNSSDQIIARNNATGLGNQLNFLVLGAGGPFAPTSSTGEGGGADVSGGDAGIASALASPSTASTPLPPPGSADWLFDRLASLARANAASERVVATLVDIDTLAFAIAVESDRMAQGAGLDDGVLDGPLAL